MTTQPQTGAILDAGLQDRQIVQQDASGFATLTLQGHWQAEEAAVGQLYIVEVRGSSQRHRRCHQSHPGLASRRHHRRWTLADRLACPRRRPLSARDTVQSSYATGSRAGVAWRHAPFLGCGGSVGDRRPE